MKRTKEWWAQLTKEERSELVRLERLDASTPLIYRSGYLPDDCTECPHCSTPHISTGLCPQCFNRLIAFIDKADAGVIAKHYNTRT